MTRIMREWSDIEEKVAQDTVDEFHRVLKAMLAEKKMTHADLGASLGVTQARASQLLRSNTNPSMRYTALVLHRLGYQLEFKKIPERK
ncbi:helix-turn-helix domain-containing protein [Brucella tritici]|uniref:helix-turn-helix domain-containing protein n=1 Tax=Brucella tritici TaxID=94626 RepID=UPI003D6CA567